MSVDKILILDIFARHVLHVGVNGQWTDSSYAAHGFIVPGTCTYAVVGVSGGHAPGESTDDISYYTLHVALRHRRVAESNS